MQVIFHHLKTVLERVHVGHRGMGAVSVSVLGVAGRELNGQTENIHTI